MDYSIMDLGAFEPQHKITDTHMADESLPPPPPSEPPIPTLPGGIWYVPSWPTLPGAVRGPSSPPLALNPHEGHKSMFPTTRYMDSRDLAHPHPKPPHCPWTASFTQTSSPPPPPLSLRF